MQPFNDILAGPLIKTGYANFDSYYLSNDDEADFHARSRAFKKSNTQWEYFDKPIHYKFNSQGYRTKEWHDIDWANSIVLHGCSYVAGEGLAEEDTISAQLSNITGRYVVNLGIPGSGIGANVHNTIMLCKNLPTPYAVVQLWSHIIRTEIYIPGEVWHCHPGQLSVKNMEKMPSFCYKYYKHWLRYDENPIAHNSFHVQASRLIWQPRTRYYELTMFSDNKLDCKFIPLIDRARDLSHPGSKTAKMVAKHIAENIN